MVQENAYYPFGTTIAALSWNQSTATNRYGYNGKEQIKDLDFNQYDYGARFYSSLTGRFGGVDPLAGKYYNINPYAFCGNNPIRYIDPDGRSYGDFWNENGKFIGNDGIDDNKVYIIKSENSKPTEKFVKDNSGNTKAFEDNKMAYNNSIEIEGSSTARQAMVTEVSKDNGKGGTSDANNREYGGSVKDGVVTVATPGDVASPKTDATASISLPTGVSTFHSHPSGTVVNAPPTGTIGGTTTTYSFTQTPSNIDISNAGNQTNYVFGRSSGTVYIYNSSGVQATIPMKYFITPKR